MERILECSDEPGRECNVIFTLSPTNGDDMSKPSISRAASQSERYEGEDAVKEVLEE